MASLFRPEVLENRQRDWLGSIQLIRPVSLGLLTAFVVATALAVASYLVLGEYTRKARVSGYLAPDQGVIRLMSPQAATLLEAHAVEGATVRRGDVLFVLSVGQSTLSGDTQAAVRSSLALREQSLQGAARQRGALEQTQLAALDRQIEDMRRELGSMAAEADLQRERLTLADRKSTRLNSSHQ